MGITATESLPEIRMETEPLDLDRVISGEKVPEILKPKPIDIDAARRAVPEIRTAKAFEASAKGFGDFARAIQGLNVKPIAATRTPSGEVAFTDIGTVKQWAKELEALGKKDAWIDQWTETFVKGGDSPEAARKNATVEWNLQKARLEKLLKDGAVVDTNLPGEAGGLLQVMDHHGPFARKESGKLQKANATMLFLNRIERALRDVGVKDLKHPTPAEIQKAKVKLGIKWVTTDNLADGAESVWVAQNLDRVMSDAGLRARLRKLEHFVDFTAFGNRYDRNSPEAALGGALFGRYDAILKKYVSPKLKPGEFLTSDRLDRLTPNEAKRAMDEATRSVSELLETAENDSAALHREADAFWKKVDAAKQDAPKTLTDRVVDPTTGRTLVNLYDQSKLAPHGLFAPWLAYPEIQRGMPDADKAPIQVTTFPMGEGKWMTLIAIQNGLKVSSKGGLLPLKEALGPEFNGKDNVLFAFTTAKSPTDIKSILSDPKFGLFQGKALDRADVESWAKGLENYLTATARNIFPGMDSSPKATPTGPIKLNRVDETLHLFAHDLGLPPEQVFRREGNALDILVPSTVDLVTLHTKLGLTVNFREKASVTLSDGETLQLHFVVGDRWPRFHMGSLPEARQSDIADWLDSHNLRLDHLTFSQQSDLIRHLGNKKWSGDDIRTLTRGAEDMPHLRFEFMATQHSKPSASRRSAPSSN